MSMETNQKPPEIHDQQKPEPARIEPTRSEAVQPVQAQEVAKSEPTRMETGRIETDRPAETNTEEPRPGQLDLSKGIDLRCAERPETVTEVKPDAGDPPGRLNMTEAFHVQHGQNADGTVRWPNEKDPALIFRDAAIDLNKPVTEVQMEAGTRLVAWQFPSDVAQGMKPEYFTYPGGDSERCGVQMERQVTRDKLDENGNETPDAKGGFRQETVTERRIAVEYEVTKPTRGLESTADSIPKEMGKAISPTVGGRGGETQIFVSLHLHDGLQMKLPPELAEAAKSLEAKAEWRHGPPDDLKAETLKEPEKGSEAWREDKAEETIRHGEDALLQREEHVLHTLTGEHGHEHTVSSMEVSRGAHESISENSGLMAAGITDSTLMALAVVVNRVEAAYERLRGKDEQKQA